MEKLSKEEVNHVAELARLNLSKEEEEKFSYQLKALLNEIDKVNEIKLNENEIMISPAETTCQTFNGKASTFEKPNDLIENAPHKFENFIEVAGVFDE